MGFSERLGACFGPDGWRFRLWAPHASSVSVVVQDGPLWETDDMSAEYPLRRLGDYWSATVTDVVEGQLYRFRISGGEGTMFEQLDPAARDVVNSELTRNDPGSRNGSVLLNWDTFAWVPFDPPRFENFLIYQFHFGSFAGRGDGHATDWSTFHDVETKLGYIRELGFNCVEPLPVHEFAMDRSWGYNPASFFAPESSYGSPRDLRHFVDAAHRTGLAVILDVVYNHAGPGDNVLWAYDGASDEGGIYFEGGQLTQWGRGPAWWKEEVQEYFYQNARMYLEEYHADGLRFDVTTQINGEHLRLVVERLRAAFPDRYFVAEHLPDDPWITSNGRFTATWCARVHHETQRALAGRDPLNGVRSVLGWDGYDHPWNLVKYVLGSHDDIGDQNDGDAEHGLTNWDTRHRYFIDQLGGRDDWTARAKCRLAWALNVAMPGTPMMFMGSECHMASPHVAWGYWHDGQDGTGDHRFNWLIAGDELGMQMRRLVSASNATRWDNPALRADSLVITHEDDANQVIGFIRETDNNAVLVVVNLSDHTFTDQSYGVRTDGWSGQWTQLLCTQDAAFGGWDGAGNAFRQPWTQPDSNLYINLPKWSVVIMRRTTA